MKYFLIFYVDSPLAKPPQVENVSPPTIAKMQQNASQVVHPNINPASSSITNPPTPGHYYQQAYNFKGIPTKDAPPVAQDVTSQHIAIGQQVLNTMPNAQAMGGIYPHGIAMHAQSMPPAHGLIPTQPVPPHGQVIPPAHGQVIATHEQIPVGLDQGQYAYNMGQPQHPQQQQQQQQQHLHPFTPSQMPPATQWQAQQQGIGPGWMK